MANYSTDLFKDNEVYRVLRFNNESEWLEGRKLGIGGSDAATACGVNKWCTDHELWLYKTNRKEHEDISEKPAVKYGSNAEEHIRQLYMLKKPGMQMHYLEDCTLQSKENPQLLYSPDGLLVDEDGRNGIWECKTTYIRHPKQKEDWDGSIPTSYYYQVLHGLNVTQFEFVELTAELRYNDDFAAIRNYHIEKTDEGVVVDMEEIKDGVLKFWQYVVNDEEPPTTIIF